MYAKVYGATIDGLDGVVVTVEVDISQGLPVFDIVGLPNQAVKESRERVRAAIKNSGFDFPMRRIVVNLGPDILFWYFINSVDEHTHSLFKSP